MEVKASLSQTEMAPQTAINFIDMEKCRQRLAYVPINGITIEPYHAISVTVVQARHTAQTLYPPTTPAT